MPDSWNLQLESALVSALTTPGSVQIRQATDRCAGDRKLVTADRSSPLELSLKAEM